MDNQVYEAPTFEIEEVEANELAADFNPADVCVLVGAGITAAVIWAAARC
jgi:hypothetical protein